MATTTRPARRNDLFTPLFDRPYYLLFLLIPGVTLLQSLLARPVAYTAAPLPRETVVSGPQWAYTVPFALRNKGLIEKLIQCESRGRNVSEREPDGLISDGILQFHRGPRDTLADGTWEDFSRASGMNGSPRDPTDAIRMTDWAISHGLGPHWACWRRLKLAAGS